MSIAVPLKCRVQVIHGVLWACQIRLSETRFGLGRFPVDGFARLCAQGLARAVTLVSLSYLIS